MDCVLKIVAGPGAGQEFHCAAAETILGRSGRCTFRLGSPSVSYEHAVVTRNGEIFFVENLSANGTFINGERILGRTRLRPRDQIRMGEETVVRVESLPGAGGGGGSLRLWLFGLVGLMVLALLVVMIFDPLSGRDGRQDWSAAYARLQEWTQSSREKLPEGMPGMLQEAWRLERAGDRKAAAREWVRLRLLIAGTPEGRALEGYSEQDRRALRRMLAPEKGSAAPASTQPDDQEIGAALVQFVDQMEKKSD